MIMQSSHLSCHKYSGKCCTSLYTEFDQSTVHRATVTACESSSTIEPLFGLSQLIYCPCRVARRPAEGQAND